MSKVYCKNCKYYFIKGAWFEPIYYLCFKDVILYKDATGKERYKNAKSCYTKNEENNCSNYKRKRYKFWVK